MKILVTGSAGFIGFFLTQQLLERGDEVVGLDNINSYYDVNLKYSRLAEAGIDRDFIREIEKDCGKRAVFDMMDMQPGDIEVTWADVDDLVSNFNYKPETPIQVGLERFMKWYKQYYGAAKTLRSSVEKQCELVLQ